MPGIFGIIPPIAVHTRHHAAHHSGIHTRHHAAHQHLPFRPFAGIHCGIPALIPYPISICDNSTCLWVFNYCPEPAVIRQRLVLPDLVVKRDHLQHYCLILFPAMVRQRFHQQFPIGLPSASNMTLPSASIARLLLRPVHQQGLVPQRKLHQQALVHQQVPVLQQSLSFSRCLSLSRSLSFSRRFSLSFSRACPSARSFTSISRRLSINTVSTLGHQQVLYQQALVLPPAAWPFTSRGCTSRCLSTRSLSFSGGTHRLELVPQQALPSAGHAFQQSTWGTVPAGAWPSAGACPSAGAWPSAGATPVFGPKLYLNFGFGYYLSQCLFRRPLLSPLNHYFPGFQYLVAASSLPHASCNPQWL